MGILIDGKELDRDIVDPFLDRVHHETIPNAQAAAIAVLASGVNDLGVAGQALVDIILTRLHAETIPQLKSVLVQALGEVLEPALQRVEDLVDRIDGASLHFGEGKKNKNEN